MHELHPRKYFWHILFLINLIIFIVGFPIICIFQNDILITIWGCNLICLIPSFLLTLGYVLEGA